ncbi:hypothetical protein ZHAS_00009254 [Anopheles sinensis]|uniref:Uncharacterized protein n=1 Tax=Anopheles sinensis TaxID=74873 RepID=A0A084VUI1_ANOSI|nr:hypothetical protein ZHAS_00009254 [Anopheles sinensis]
MRLKIPEIVAHPFASQKVDKLILEETEAGRRFLATLRRNHEKELLEAGGESHPSPAQPDDGSTIVVARSLAKDKRSSLRATLEHLIVRYLRRLTASGDEDENGEDNGEAARYRRQSPMGHDRTTSTTTTVGSLPPPEGEEPVGGTAGPGVISSSMEITLLTNDTDTNLTDAWDGSERFQQQQLKDSGHGYGLPGSSVSGQSGEKGVELAHESGARRDTAWDRSVGASAGQERVPPHGANGGGVSGSSESVENTASEGQQQQQGADVSATHDKLRVGDGDGMPLGVGSDPGVMGTGEGHVKAPGSGGGLRRQKQRECGNVRKRVSQLDRFELERSMRNGSFREYNIRNALNYR